MRKRFEEICTEENFKKLANCKKLYSFIKEDLLTKVKRREGFKFTLAYDYYYPPLNCKPHYFGFLIKVSGYCYCIYSFNDGFTIDNINDYNVVISKIYEWENKRLRITFEKKPSLGQQVVDNI